MKVLFALNNDNVANAIIKEYQKQYKEILSYKNVYYFNAILKELQKDKSYDRVVISEELEPFANNDYDTIDKFIFEKLDRISDEATNQEDEDIAIIVICANRRNRRDDMLNKFFGLGIYNALIENDRQIKQVCKLINRPRTKKEAKIYYKIESNDVNYQSENENSVSETEVQNILAHYKRLGKNEEKYVDSFNTIVSQYTNEQLKVIIKFLPMNVKAVLEEKSPKYQELVTFDASHNKHKNNYAKKDESTIDIKMLDAESNKSNINRPIVIPTTIKNHEIKRITNKKAKDNISDIDNLNDMEDFNEEDIYTDIEEQPKQVKRGRGRPKKNVEPIEQNLDTEPKRGRGRPKKETKNVEDIQNDVPTIKKIEVPEIEVDDTIDLFNMDNNTENTQEEPINPFEMEDENQDEAVNLFEMEENSENEPEDEPINLFDINDDMNEPEQKEEEKPLEIQQIENKETDNYQNDVSDEKYKNDIIEAQNKQINNEMSKILTKDKKIVSFVGTTKNGTSFLVNNVATMLADMNIPTAILDMTKTKNAYYIYTNNEETLRNIATQSILDLEHGIAKGIKVNKNLTVYTSLPGENTQNQDINAIITTLMNNYSVVIIDCDFTTPIEIFEKSQEIYLVQTQDVLTIQPLTAFLRELKIKNALPQEKLKIVINKEQNIAGLSDSVLIGGISSYNDPSMSFMTELFDKNKVIYCKISFEMQNYAKYLSALVNCNITLKGYTKKLIKELQQLASMVYPLVNQPKYISKSNNKKNITSVFSNEINNTLNKMKKNY